MNNITSKQLLSSLRLRFQFFPSHLVERSIWPIYLSFTLFSLAISAVEYMHGYSTGFILLRASFVLTIMGMALWWKDVIIEATFLGDHTKKVREGILQGFILFVVSEVMVFLSVF
jgi:cytochrome c oxidase subunit 3